MGILTKATALIARGLRPTDPRLSLFFAGGPTFAGENVTVDSALQLDTVWACVRLVSQTIATLPLFLYRRDEEARGSIASDHSLYRILHDRPNADMTSTEFWEAMAASVLLWGNAFALIARGTGNAVVALTPMRPDRITVRRQTDGSLQYRYSFDGRVETFDEGDVFHIKGFSLDGLVGLSPIAQARQSIGAAVAAEKASATFFKNGMRPSAVMESPAYLNDTQRAQAKGIIERFSGAVNSGGVPLVEGGWKLNTQVSIPPDDAQLLATRGFNVEVIARWFDVPPVMIGHMEKSTAWGTGMEQMMLWFLTFSLRPHLKRIEQAISRDLLQPDEQISTSGGLYAEFNVEGLLRADSAGRAALYKVLAENGLRTRNELRALDNEPPLPGGDDLTVMGNLLPIQLLGKVKMSIPPATPEDPNFVPSEPAAPAGSEKNPDASPN